MKTIASVFVLLAASTSFAAPASLIALMLQSDEVQAVTERASIVSIEETASYRCMGCFAFVITQNKSAVLQKFEVRTMARGGDLDVKIIEANQ